MEWVQVTTDTVLAHMPTDVLARYTVWITDNPDRSERLSEITANSIREWRDAIKSNVKNIYHEDETYLPQSLVRHVETIIYFCLAMEIGITIDTSGNSARNSADVALRQIPFGRWNTTTDDDYSRGTPSFAVPSRSEFSTRALPAFLAILFWASTAIGGWIKPGSVIYDTDIITTILPTNYVAAASTLIAHLYGIDGKFAQLQAGTNFYTKAQSDALYAPIALSSSAYPASNPSNFISSSAVATGYFSNASTSGTSRLRVGKPFIISANTAEPGNEGLGGNLQIGTFTSGSTILRTNTPGSIQALRASGGTYTVIEPITYGAMQRGSFSSGNNVISNSSHGSSQIGVFEGSIATIDRDTYGAEQHGYFFNNENLRIGNNAHGSAIRGFYNVEAGSVEIADNTRGASINGTAEAGMLTAYITISGSGSHWFGQIGNTEVATITGNGSLGIGAVTITEDDSLAVQGSITAGGGYYGSAEHLTGYTNYPDILLRVADFQASQAMTNTLLRVPGGALTNVLVLIDGAGTITTQKIISITAQ